MPEGAEEEDVKRDISIDVSVDNSKLMSLNTLAMHAKVNNHKSIRNLLEKTNVYR